MPSQTQVYYWLKNSRRESPTVVDLGKRQRLLSLKQKFQKMVMALESRRQDNPKTGSRGQFGMAKCLDAVSLLLMNDQSYEHILLLARTSKLINNRLKRSEVYGSVQRIAQGRMVDIDAQLILAQIE